MVQAAFEVLLRRYCGAADDTPFQKLVGPGVQPSRTTDLTLVGNRIEYNADLFKADTIDRIIAQLATLVANAQADPNQPISRIPILPDAERKLVTQTWNDTRADYASTKCVHELIAEQAARTPNQVAVVFEDKSLTYAELDARANALAAHLRQLGVGPETRVGICVRRSLDMMVGLIAIHKAGGAYVPMDPSYPKERLAFMMEDAQAPLLLTQSALKGLVPAANAQRVELDKLRLTEQPLAHARGSVTPENLAYVIYTSGSTGKPKGVMVQHRNASNFFTGMDGAIGAEPGTWLAVTSISFDISVLELFWTLSRGFKVVIQAEEMLASKGHLIADQISRHGVTHFQCTPSLMGMLLDDPKTAEALKGVKKFFFGGEALAAALVQRMQGYGEMFNMYGPTETTVWSTVHPVTREGGSICIGRPIANTEIYILDQHGQPCPINVPGELYIGGASVVRGYLNRPELTAERFVANPFVQNKERGTRNAERTDGERMYRTGDLARWLADGRIEFLGRMDYQVKLRGFRIELGEIEAALREHPAIKDCVVAVWEAAENDKRLVGYMVSANPPKPVELRKFLKQKLPEYMVPSMFVTLDTLPLTPNGKIDRKALPKPGATREDGSAGTARRAVVLPLTEPQREIWLNAQMGEAGSVAFNQGFQLALGGALDVKGLQRALEKLIEMHEALRVTIAPDGGQQYVHADMPYTLSMDDLTGKPELLNPILEKEGRSAFDFVKGPLWRMRLLKLEPQRHILAVTVHHIIADSGAVASMLQDLGKLYAAESGIGPAPSAPPQLSAFVQEQKRLEQAADRAKAEKFWIEQFKTPPPPLNLPADRPRPSMRTFNGGTACAVVDVSLLNDLRKVSGKNRCTLFTTLLAGYYVFLHRLSGQNEIVAGVPFSARQGEGSERLVAHGVNFLPFRVKIEGNPKFTEVLSRVRALLLDAYENQNYTYGNLVQKIELPRDPSRMPLLDVMFNLDGLAEEMQIAGLETSELTLNPFGRSSFDLNINLLAGPKRAEFQVQYSSDLFDAETIQRWLRHFTTLLRGIAAAPETPVGKLPLLAAEERKQIVEDWNCNALPYAKDTVMHQLFEEQVRSGPDRVALRWGKIALTYADLDGRANQVTHWLAKQGVKPQTLVGVCMERTPDLIAALLGIMKAGCAYVPLDPSYPEERLQLMLSAANAPIVMSAAEMQSLGADTSPLSVTVGPEDLAYIMFTSGSTGGPKAVGLEHRNAVAFLHWARSVFTDEELSGVLASTAISFDLSVFEIFVPLSWGGTIVLADGPLELPNINGVKLVNTVPTAIAELVKQKGIPPSVQTVNLAGEALSQKLVEEIYENSNVKKVYDLYGPTENTTYSTFTLRRCGGRATIGRPLANSETYILDTYGEPTPIGVPGELYVAGALLTRGYINNPELTAQKFVAHPFKAGARAYRTGDLTRYLPNGDIEFLGRIDHQIKIRGYRIEPGEIENELANHSGLEDNVVVMREDTPGQPYLAAYVVARPGTQIAGHDLRQFLHERIPTYMIPSNFVVMEKLPLTPNGKVDRRALPVPNESAPEGGGASADAPLNEVESALAAIWREVIGVDEVRRDDNFFDLGGHSVLVTQMLTRLRRDLGVELTLRNVFESPSLGELAQIIDAQLTQQLTQSTATQGASLMI
ncbi:MAG TPA: amino acid adenylation domain-containing protein [Candidatus Binatia bacterium]|nr:amino acid adenylation domain-containing protein [Candidatus Binatia bacterium]